VDAIPQRPALGVKAIGKSFGPSKALAEVSFEVAAGSVHALVGENGAGKSTLVKIITGIIEADEGEILLDGERVRFATPIEARAAGVAAVYQDPKLFPHLDVAENISMGDEPVTPLGTVDRNAMHARAAAALAQLDVAIDPRAPIAGLSVAELQFVEIARALTADLRLLILDEPTSTLTPSEAEKLFRIVRRLRDRGTAVMLITHRLEELEEIADRVTVLRDGAHVATRPMREVTRTEIVQMMVGRPLESLFAKRAARPPGAEVFRVEDLALDGVFSGVSFALRAGEIVGMAGLVGAGRSEIAQACFGMTPPTAGRLFLDGVPIVPRSPRQMLRAGLAYLPEDRDTQGLIMEATILGNVTLPIVGRLSRLGFVDAAAQRAVAAEAMRTYDVRATGPEQIVSLLSGGNRQKVAFARWLATEPRVLILDEPTHGIDVGSKAQVHRIIAGLADTGLAILLISSDLPEILAMSDRILVIADGELVAELDPAAVDQHAVMMAATRNTREIAGVS
jgi:rhamnose transport system ATP-binding protein